MEVMVRNNGLPPVHPGEILREDILPEVNLTVTSAAKALGISRQMLHGVLAESRPLSAVMCLRVAKLFGSSPRMWMGLQAEYDLRKATEDKKVMQSIRKIARIAEMDSTQAS